MLKTEIYGIKMKSKHESTIQYEKIKYADDY